MSHHSRTKFLSQNTNTGSFNSSPMLPEQGCWFLVRKLNHEYGCPIIVSHPTGPSKWRGNPTYSLSVVSLIPYRYYFSSSPLLTFYFISPSHSTNEITFFRDRINHTGMVSIFCDQICKLTEDTLIIFSLPSVTREDRFFFWTLSHASTNFIDLSPSLLLLGPYFMHHTLIHLYLKNLLYEEFQT